MDHSYFTLLVFLNFCVLAKIEPIFQVDVWIISLYLLLSSIIL